MGFRVLNIEAKREIRNQIFLEEGRRQKTLNLQFVGGLCKSVGFSDLLPEVLISPAYNVYLNCYSLRMFHLYKKKRFSLSFSVITTTYIVLPFCPSSVFRPDLY